MKRLLAMATLVCGTLVAGAQAKDTTLQEYVGKYTFPEGSHVATAEIILNGEVLSVSSAQGGSPLEKKARDTFALTAFQGGMIYFTRNKDGKVAKVKVEVGDLLMEGAKDGATAWFNREKYLDDRQTKQAR